MGTKGVYLPREPDSAACCWIQKSLNSCMQQGVLGGGRQQYGA